MSLPHRLAQAANKIQEAHYSKAAATAMHIPAKWVYDEFFKLIKDSGAMFNRLKAESTLEYIFGLMHNPKSPYLKYQGTDVLLSSALIEYKKIMGIREAAEKPKYIKEQLAADFKRIADIIRQDIKNINDKILFAQRTIDIEKNNPRFKRDLFIDACGLSNHFKK